ncbi:hypothetical protein Bbelb_347830 [Branchiostoma belcheri]|nr:hypothetical protein Bbelb_347830 [Branchiostoma belcheri]
MAAHYMKLGRVMKLGEATSRLAAEERGLEIEQGIEKERTSATPKKQGETDPAVMAGGWMGEALRGKAFPFIFSDPPTHPDPVKLLTCGDSVHTARLRHCPITHAG